MATKQVTYTGTIPVDQPTLDLHWEPGQTQAIDEALADQWTNDPQSPFSGSRSKDAQEAKAAAVTSTSAPAPVVNAQQQQPAEAPAGGES